MAPRFSVVMGAEALGGACPASGVFPTTQGLNQVPEVWVLNGHRGATDLIILRFRPPGLVRSVFSVMAGLHGTSNAASPVGHRPFSNQGPDNGSGHPDSGSGFSVPTQAGSGFGSIRALLHSGVVHLSRPSSVSVLASSPERGGRITTG